MSKSNMADMAERYEEIINVYYKSRLPRDKVAIIFGAGGATHVRGGIVPFSGHWITEERPDFLVKELVRFFSE